MCFYNWKDIQMKIEGAAINVDIFLIYLEEVNPSMCLLLLTLILLVKLRKE